MKTGKVIPFPIERRIPSCRPKAYTLRVYLVRGPYGRHLEGSEIYRTLEIRGDQTLEDLHYAILYSFDRKQDGAFDFFTGSDPSDHTGVLYISGDHEQMQAETSSWEGKSDMARMITLDALELEHDQFFSYRFKAREEWTHLIHVLRFGAADLNWDYPILIEKVGRTPVPVNTGEADREEAYEEGSISEDEMLSLLMGEFQVLWRRQVENEALQPDTRLKTALNKLPFHWIEGICQQIGMEDEKNRKERTRKLLELLPTEDLLKKVWDPLPSSSREILRWLLEEREGWATIQHLSRKFGRDPDKSWWWNEGQVPKSPLGMLRVSGLVYVGRTRSGKRRVRIAAVPLELRKTLGQIVKEPGWRNKVHPFPLSFPLNGSGGEDASGEAKRGSSTKIPFSAPFNTLWKEMDSRNLKSFLSLCPLQRETECLYIHMLTRVRREPCRFSLQEVRRFLKRMIEGCTAWNRLSAYRLGVALFGKNFARPAGKDNSRMIRQWAQSLSECAQEDLFS